LGSLDTTFNTTCGQTNEKVTPPPRWVKFEEKVEEGARGGQAPRLLHSLFELRTCLQTGSILLDLEGDALPQIVGQYTHTHTHILFVSMREGSRAPLL